MEKQTMTNARILLQEAKLVFKASWKNRDTDDRILKSLASACYQLRTARVEYKVAVRIFFVAFDRDLKDITNKFDRALISFDRSIDLLARSEAQKAIDQYESQMTELHKETITAMMAV